MADFEREHRSLPTHRSSSKTSDHTPSTPQHPLLDLQRQVGNGHVARLLAQRESTPEAEEIQALRDPVQRQPETEEEAAIQALRAQRMAEVGAEGGDISSATAARIQAQRGSGTALDPGMRSSMEAAFNTDFSDVHVHTSGESAELNRRLGAHAFTTGSDIFLGNTASVNDSGLMAHELTHVVQQRAMSTTGPARVTAADDAHEQEAHAMAQQVTQRLHHDSDQA